MRCFKEREEFYLFGDGNFLEMEEEFDPEARWTAESEGLMKLEASLGKLVCVRFCDVYSENPYIFFLLLFYCMLLLMLP